MNLPKFQDEKMEIRNLVGLLAGLAVIIFCLYMGFREKEPEVLAWRNSMLFTTSDKPDGIQFMIEFGFRSDGVILWRRSGIIVPKGEELKGLRTNEATQAQH